jgi:peptide/nickel transport system substrate-binding protein
MFTSDTITDANDPGGNNFVGFSDSVVDRLVKAAMSTYDQVERASLYRQLQQELAAQLPYLFLWGLVNYDLVRGAVTTADGLPDPTVQYWAWQPERMVVAAP